MRTREIIPTPTSPFVRSFLFFCEFGFAQHLISRNLHVKSCRWMTKEQRVRLARLTIAQEPTKNNKKNNEIFNSKVEVHNIHARFFSRICLTILCSLLLAKGDFHKRYSTQTREAYRGPLVPVVLHTSRVTRGAPH